MSRIFYDIFLLLYKSGIRLAAWWNHKAAWWIRGRKNIFQKLESGVAGNKTTVWIHCASLGEFEQGRPVMEKIKSRFPGSKLVLTFFSPSGYEIRKDYKGADGVFYLPPDSRSNAKRFLDIVSPSLVVFIKYDYWYYYLAECRKRNIPLLMVSAVFRKNQPFFKWYGSIHREMLHCFTHFFVQDENSEKLLRSLEISGITVAGDTRFDRVTEIAEKAEPLPLIEKFCGNNSVLVAGSTWPEDEKIIKEAAIAGPGMKIIIAPHEIHKSHLQHLQSLFPDSVFFSQLTRSNFHAQETILIIDSIGLLSTLYRYATITYVGGGFNKGIHNTLEAAVHGKPVIFGPRHEKFREAIDLKENGGGIGITNSNELKEWISTLLGNEADYTNRCKKSRDYVQEKKGATGKILHYIQENRLLTS